MLKRIVYWKLEWIEKQEGQQRKRYLNKKYYAENRERLKHKRWLKLKGEADELNEKFKGSDGHHINERYIVYIPREIHRSVWHSLPTGKGMVQINKRVFRWVVSERNGELEYRLRSILPEYMIPV